jgi:hypothetical protein
MAPVNVNCWQGAPRGTRFIRLQQHPEPFFALLARYC